MPKLKKINVKRKVAKLLNDGTYINEHFIECVGEEIVHQNYTFAIVKDIETKQYYCIEPITGRNACKISTNEKNAKTKLITQLRNLTKEQIQNAINKFNI